MADEDDRVERAQAEVLGEVQAKIQAREAKPSARGWDAFLNLVPPEVLAAPPPVRRPQPPVPDPAEEAKVRAIKLQIEKDRIAENQKRADNMRAAQQEGFDILKRIHQAQKNMKL